VTLGQPAELLKLPADQMLPLPSPWPMVRVSAARDRLLYVRRYGSRAKLHLRKVGSAQSDDPVAWVEPIPTFYCWMSFAGIVWRADGKRVLFCQEPARDEPGYVAGVFGQAMRPWHVCYDLPMPQFTSCHHARIEGASGCTALSYSPDGNVLWTAFSEPKGFKVCGVTAASAADKSTRVAFRRTGAAIYHLVPSPDGRYLAWVETFPSKAGGAFRGPEVVVFDIKGSRTAHRVSLSQHVPAWLDTQPPVWTADSAAICYGDVVEQQGTYRREVRLLPLAKGKEQVLVRDALAVGAIEEGIIANRGPACEPMRQLISSYVPPGGTGGRPLMNQIVLCGGSARGAPAALVSDAFAQQVVGRHLIYAQRNGDDVIVMSVRLARGEAR
jgi:hypothetical protein